MPSRMRSPSRDTDIENIRPRKRKRSTSPDPTEKKSTPKDAKSNPRVTQSKSADVVPNIYGKTGGAYIPPARLRQMQAAITDKSSEAYQRIAWEALKKSIHGLINKVNVSNISDVVRQLLSENVVRGRGLLVRSLMTAQMTSPTFTHVFAALVSIVNSKFPQVGELVLKRQVNEFRKAFRRNQKDRCLSMSRFLAHLVNQKVVHELIVLELLTLLLEKTTDDSVEVAVSVLKECGAMLTRLVPKGVHGVFEHLRRILNEGQCDKRISYMLEVMFQIRRDGWKDHPIVLPELDLIPDDDQITHTTSLLDQVDPEDPLNVFRFDENYLENEEKYARIKASFFESDDESSGSGGDDSDDDDAADSDAQDEGEGGDGAERAQGAHAASSTADGQSQNIIDQTATNLVQLRRTIYLMLQSSLSADEAGHRLLQLKIHPGEEYEVASMVLDCCAQTRSYETRYGRLAQRLCRVLLTFNTGVSGSKPAAAEEVGPGGRYRTSQRVNRADAKAGTAVVEATDAGPPRSYVAEFERIFSEQYAIIHRLETAKLRNVALFFSHLLHTDSISWGVLECVRLNERDTSSSGRIFLKHLLLELCSFMGLAKLQARLRDDTLQTYFAGLLPRDNPKDTRFAINFLTTIGLGGLTLDLREHLKVSREATLARQEAEANAVNSVEEGGEEVVPSASSSSASSASSSSSSSDSESSSSDEERSRKKRKKRKTKTKKTTSKKHKRKDSKHSREHGGSRDKTDVLESRGGLDIADVLGSRGSPDRTDVSDRRRDREMVEVSERRGGRDSADISDRRRGREKIKVLESRGDRDMADVWESRDIADVSESRRGREKTDVSERKRGRNRTDMSDNKMDRDMAHVSKNREDRDMADVWESREGRDDMTGVSERRRGRKNDDVSESRRDRENGDVSERRKGREKTDVSERKRGRNRTDVSENKRDRDIADVSENKRDRDIADVSKNREDRDMADVWESREGHDDMTGVSKSRRGRGNNDVSERRKGREKSDVSESRRDRDMADMSESREGRDQTDVSERKKGRDKTDKSESRRNRDRTDVSDRRRGRKRADVSESEGSRERRREDEPKRTRRTRAGGSPFS